MGRSVHTLNVGGHARGLVLHAAAPPATPSSTGRSLLLLLHGSTEDRNNGSVHYPAERFERNYHGVFAGHGFTLVYLSARLSKGWYCWENGNAEVGLCARSPDENDQHFTRAAVELVDREVGPVDRTRVHVLGMSGGASMAWRLGCESRSRDITGLSPRVAAVAGTIAPSLRTCCCASPVVVALHGDADTFVDVQAADAAAAWFAHAHGCTAADAAASSHAAPAPDVTLTSYRCSTERANTNTNTYTYTNANTYKDTDTDTSYNGTLNASTRLDYFRVAGGGHTLPGAPLVWRGLGPTSSFDGFGAIRQSWAAIDPSPAATTMRPPRRPLRWCWARWRQPRWLSASPRARAPAGGGRGATSAIVSNGSIGPPPRLRASWPWAAAQRRRSGLRRRPALPPLALHVHAARG